MAGDDREKILKIIITVDQDPRWHLYKYPELPQKKLCIMINKFRMKYIFNVEEGKIQRINDCYYYYENSGQPEPFLYLTQFIYLHLSRAFYPRIKDGTKIKFKVLLPKDHEYRKLFIEKDHYIFDSKIGHLIEVDTTCQSIYCNQLIIQQYIIQ